MNMVLHFKVDPSNEMNSENALFFSLVWYNSYNFFLQMRATDWLHTEIKRMSEVENALGDLMCYPSL